MAVIINGLSQCDSCGPLKIGLNNKIPAYGNFFSSPAPSFSLPRFSLVMHANVSSPFPPSQTPPPLPRWPPPPRDSSRGQTMVLLSGDSQVGTDPPGPLPCSWHWTDCLTHVTSVISWADLSPYTPVFLLPARPLPLWATLQGPSLKSWSPPSDLPKSTFPLLLPSISTPPKASVSSLVPTTISLPLPSGPLPGM